MKQYAFLCLIMAVILLVAPLSALLPKKTGQEHAKEIESSLSDSNQTEKQTVEVSEKPKDDTISVFMTADSQTVTMEMRDYIIGVVAAEMPASYETEALKAQALVAVTYAEYNRLHPENDSDADISDDSSRHQGYMTTDEMKEKWADAFDSYYDRIASAVDEVSNLMITYEDEPIMAAYHAISSGQTESAENLWGKDIPYLQSVDSEWDKYSSRYTTEVTFTAEEIKNLLKDNKSAKFPDDDEEWIKITETSASGTVLEAEICRVKMTGTQIRELLALRSPVFDVKFNDGEFIFTVYGYGHGAGMSQNGANCMAKEGKTCEEIIKHYYTGVEIKEY